MQISATDEWCMIAVAFFIIMDYITGVVKAIMADNLSSRKMREGLGHKFAYLLLVFVAYAIDTFNTHTQLGLPVDVFACVVGGICLIELTSILENITAINPELASAPFMHIFATVTDTDKDKDK